MITKSARHPVFSNLLMVVVIFGGLWCFSNLRKEASPEVSLDLITVTVAYPGASAYEVEEGIAIKIEQVLRGTEGISKIESSAQEGVSTTTIELRENLADPQKVLSDIKDKIERISTLPDNSEEPEVREVKVTQPAFSMILNGEVPERTLYKLAHDIKEELFLLGISQIQLDGMRNYEISIEVSEEKLRSFNITLDQVVDIVRKGSINLPAGSIRTKTQEYKIEIKGLRYVGKEYRDLIVLTKDDSTNVRLHDIAKVNDGFEEYKNVGRYNQKKSILFNISTTKDEDTIEVADKVKHFIRKKQNELPPGVLLTVFTDFSEDIKDRINLLLKNAAQGLVLLFLTLWLFLNLRLSLWVTVGIPFSFAFAGLIVWFSGESLNMINLFGLILVLGIVVDDAIVVGENIYRHQLTDSSPMEAAIRGAKEMSWPVIAAISTTILTFIPLFFLSGVLGKFISALPLVVVATLLGSLVESLLILPSHLGHKKPTKQKTKIRQSIDKITEFIIQRIYFPMYKFSLKQRYNSLALVLLLLLIAAGMVGGGIVPYVLLPDSDSISLKAEVAFPQGSPIYVTEKAIKQIEKAAILVNKKYGTEKNPLILGVYSKISGNQSHKGSVEISLVKPEKRNFHSKDILNYWREYVGSIRNSIEITFSSQGAIPTPDIELILEGNDLKKLRDLSLDVQKILSGYKAIYSIKSNLQPGKRELLISLKPNGRLLGISLADLAQQIRRGFYGVEALKIQRGKNEVEVQVRYPKSQRNSLQDLYNIHINTPSGEKIPFLEVASAIQKRGIAEIKRRNGKRRAQITAAVYKSLSTPDEVIGNIRKQHLSQLIEKYPRITISFEGSQKETQKTTDSLAVGFLFSLLGIYTILTLVFRSYLQPFLIMSVIPFGLIGAIFGHYLLGYSLTMLSFFGIIALAGVVVNDALVLIDRINENQRKGMSVIKSVEEAGPTRFRAVVLTSLTTIAGVLPLISEVEFQAQFLKPMAISLAAGLFFATFLTLFIVPCFYLILNDLRRIFVWLISGNWPSREQVEPSSTIPTPHTK